MNKVLTISNDTLTISVAPHGAELTSVVSHGREYLWQADAAFWKRHSPVLFPIVGALWNGEYRSHGNTYKMGQHGFARDMDFQLLSESETELRYQLTSNADTKQKYPYDFSLVIGYQLIGNRVRVSWHVENTGNETMALQIGAHPAFFWPMLSDEQIEGGVDAMATPLAETSQRGFFRLEAKGTSLPVSVITESGCVGKTAVVTTDADGYLPLDVDTFNDDALIFENSQVTKVTLCRQDKSPYLSLEFTSPLVGLWSPPGKRAPFVCIEPWYGRTDAVGYEGSYEEKPWMQQLPAGESFDVCYDIIVEE